MLSTGVHAGQWRAGGTYYSLLRKSTPHTGSNKRKMHTTSALFSVGRNNLARNIQQDLSLSYRRRNEFSSISSRLGRVNKRTSISIRQFSSSSQQQQQSSWWGKGSRIHRFGMLLRYTRIPVLIVGVYSLGYQQGVIGKDDIRVP